jgi:hypothetical protein
MKKATRKFFCQADCVFTHTLGDSRTNVAGVLWKELAKLNGRVRDGG